MPDYWTSIIIGVLMFALAIPYVMRIRHPQQKPFAAYLIFMSVFAMVSGILFYIVAWLIGKFDLESNLAGPGSALLSLTLIFLPAVITATWLARKPPRRVGPPP